MHRKQEAADPKRKHPIQDFEGIPFLDYIRGFRVECLGFRILGFGV